MGEPGLNDMVLLPRLLFTDPQNAGPAPSVKYFCVVITLRSLGPVMGGCLSDLKRQSTLQKVTCSVRWLKRSLYCNESICILLY